MSANHHVTASFTSFHQAPAGMHALHKHLKRARDPCKHPQEWRGKHLLGSFLIAGKRCAALLCWPLGGPQGPARGRQPPQCGADGLRRMHRRLRQQLHAHEGTLSGLFLLSCVSCWTARTSPPGGPQIPGCGRQAPKRCAGGLCCMHWRLRQQLQMNLHVRILVLSTEKVVTQCHTQHVMG